MRELHGRPMHRRRGLQICPPRYQCVYIDWLIPLVPYSWCTTVDDDDGLFGYPEPPMFAPFSPLSPMSPISPVLVPYPFVYPMVSPLQPFALPVIPGPLPMTPPPTMQPTPTLKVPPSAKNNLTVVTSVARPIATAQPYSPHRVVDGATLLPTGSHRVDNATAARAVVRPLSTPPTPVHGPDASIAKVRNRRL